MSKRVLAETYRKIAKNKEGGSLKKKKYLDLKDDTSGKVIEKTLYPVGIGGGTLYGAYESDRKQFEKLKKRVKAQQGAKLDEDVLHVTDKNGDVEAKFDSGTRIISRRETNKLFNKAADKKIKDEELAKFVEKIFIDQDNRPPEYAN